MLGYFDLVFSDENGCSSTLLNGGVGQETIVTNNVTIAEIDDFSTVDVLCNGSSTGVLYASNVNTDPAFTYSWQDLNGNVVGTSAVASGLSAGTYVLYAIIIIRWAVLLRIQLLLVVPIINPSASITDVIVMVILQVFNCFSCWRHFTTGFGIQVFQVYCYNLSAGICAYSYRCK